MTNAICAKCQAEYDKKSELDSTFCALCRMRRKVTIYEFVSVIFFAFGGVGILMFLPTLAIFPLVVGTNSLGYYWVPFFSRRGTWVTPFAFLMANLVNLGLTIAFLSVWIYFKRKHDKTKIHLSEIEKDTPHFGRRWKE